MTEHVQIELLGDGKHAVVELNSHEPVQYVPDPRVNPHAAASTLARWEAYFAGCYSRRERR